MKLAEITTQNAAQDSSESEREALFIITTILQCIMGMETSEYEAGWQSDLNFASAYVWRDESKKTGRKKEKDWETDREKPGQEKFWVVLSAAQI